MKKYKIGVIGCGEMAYAILQGAVASGIVSADDIICSARREQSLEKCKKEGYAITLDNVAVADQSEYLMIGVRPQDFPLAAESISFHCHKVISIMAGVPSAKIKALTGANQVARCMPNLPCRIGYGMCGVDISDFNDEEGAFLLNLFASRGKSVSVREDQIEAVTGISGSGPAYVYYFIESMVKSGIKLGLDEKTARELAVQTVIGGAKMVEASNKSFEELISSVCSKGGTTIEAIGSFKADHLDETIDKGIQACVKRAKELSK